MLEFLKKLFGFGTTSSAVQVQDKPESAAEASAKSVVIPADAPEYKKMVDEAPYHPGYEGAVVKDSTPSKQAKRKPAAKKPTKPRSAKTTK